MSDLIKHLFFIIISYNSKTLDRKSMNIYYKKLYALTRIEKYHINILINIYKD